MEADTFKEALTKKYGPLPGYAWAGIGAIGLVIVVRLRKGSGAVPTYGSATPATDGSLGRSGGGGGGGGFDLPTVPGPSDSGVPTISDPTAPFDPGTIPTAPSAPVARATSTPTTKTTTTPVTAADYFAASPLPQGTSTADALAALSLFPATSYDFSPVGVDFSGVTAMENASQAAAAAAPGGIKQTAVTNSPTIHATPTVGVNPSAIPSTESSPYSFGVGGKQ